MQNRLDLLSLMMSEFFFLVFKLMIYLGVVELHLCLKIGCRQLSGVILVVEITLNSLG